MDLKPGQTLGNYRISERLVTGGMAKVYRAQQPSTGRDVAIKVLTLDTDPKTEARFEREAQLLAHLQHPHILGLIDAGHEGDWHYLVVPLVRCGDLGDLIAREDGPLPLPLLKRAILQLCAALEYAHSQGVVHRDIKPANVLLDEHGNCVLTDFGIALAEGAQRLTLVGFAIGTPEYLAPEQGTGQDDARSDLYSLGVVLFQMATGRLPFQAQTPTDWLLAHRATPAPAARAFNPALPEALENVIAKALKKAPNERFQTAAQFAAAVREALPEATYGEHVVRGETTSPTVQTKPAMSSPKLLPALAVAAALIIVLGAGWLWRSHVRTPPQPVAVSPASTQLSPVAKLFDGFDDAQYDQRLDPSRWHLTKANARMQIQQHGGVLHIRSQEREHGIYAEFPSTRLSCLSARLRLEAPVSASEATLGVSLSRLDHPGEWVSCYLYATRGATTATPSCTNQLRHDFRPGDVASIGSWHDVSLRVDPGKQTIAFAADGRALGDLPFANADKPTTWYLLLSGWSGDGQPVEGAVDSVSVDCAD